MRPTRSSVALAALVGAGGAAWGVSLSQYLHPPLAPALRQALAHALGVKEEAVAVGRAELSWPARLVVTDLAAAGWTAGRVEVDVDAWAALGGRPRIWRVRARDVVNDHGRAGEVEASWAHGHGRVALRRVILFPVEHWLGGLGLSLGEVGLETERGVPRRLAFAGARVGGVGEVAGAATRAPDGAWLVRAARPGLTATAQVDGTGVVGQANLERFGLAALPAPRGLALGDATASGTIDFSVGAAGVRATPHLGVDGFGLAHPALARRAIDGVDLTLDGEIGWRGGAWVARGLQVGVGHARVVVDGTLGPGGAFDVAATLPRVACAELLAALPRALVPHLDGLQIDGEIGGRLRVARAADDATGLKLDVAGAIACRARADAPLGDVGSLARPDAPVLVRHVVDGRVVPLSPLSPSWRALDALPAPVVRAFVVAEDGRFFSHHGFDVDRIGRALATDLEAGRLDRGASTITQQVAKNLWLSGERTLGRKLEEAVLAWRLEQVLDKRRILELYLNLAELGPGVYGIQDAAERYFGKLPEELSADEAAQLAALLPAPRHGMDAAWRRRYQALAARMPPTVKLSRR